VLREFGVTEALVERLAERVLLSVSGERLTDDEKLTERVLLRVAGESEGVRE